MSYFRKSILLFVFMFGALSVPYAVAKEACKTIEAHMTAVGISCKGNRDGDYALNGACYIHESTVGEISLCKSSKVNPGAVTNNWAGPTGYCPDGANGTTCVCKKGTNWNTVRQKCFESR